MIEYKTVRVYSWNDIVNKALVDVTFDDIITFLLNGIEICDTEEYKLFYMPVPANSMVDECRNKLKQIVIEKLDLPQDDPYAYIVVIG